MKTNTQKIAWTLLIASWIAAPALKAQSANDSIHQAANPFAGITIIKLNEVATKDDVDKVKEALRIFGNRIHSYKINFERRQVVVRMRQPVPNEELVHAFQAAGYTAWYDENEKILPGDAAYRGTKK